MDKKLKVTLYGTHICSWCRLVREFLYEHKISFQDVYVDKDKKNAAEMIRKSGQHHVPVIEIGKKIIVGFDESELKKALKIS